MEGKVHVEGNITYFEAEDLEQKIKLSSPIAKKEGCLLMQILVIQLLKTDIFRFTTAGLFEKWYTEQIV